MPAASLPLARISQVAFRRQRATERQQAAQDRSLTFKQRAGLALSKLSQTQLDEAVAAMATAAAKGDARGIAALARISQVAFGTTKEGQDDGGAVDQHTALADMTLHSVRP